MKRILVLALLLVSLLPLFSGTRAEDIYFYGHEELVALAEEYGIDTDLDDELLRSAILEAEGLTEESSLMEDKTGEGGYTLEIVSADRLSLEGGNVDLTGKVVISFTSKGSDPQTLSASRIIIDSENSKLTALGDALFTDSNPDAPIQEISGDIFTLLFEKGDIFISGGTTSSERKNVDGDSISFYTSGETLSHYDNGSIVFENGYITSNPKHAYSSISAKKLELLPGGDMFLSEAFFKIGRVPVFYLPFLAYPGSRIVGNPAFGFTSTKGAFLNTTFEVFGSYPDFKEQDSSSSFTSILKSTDESGKELPSGFYYNDRPETELESWASENGSYLTVFADSYSGGTGVFSSILPQGGLHLGFETKLNFLDDKLKVNFKDGVGASSPVVSNGGTTRYYGVNTVSYADKGFRLTGSFPFYSDPYVMRDFGNRLTTFSIEPLLGTSLDFPNTYTGGITSFSRSLSTSYSLPSSHRSDLLSSFSVSDFTLKAEYGEDTRSNAESAYYRKSLVLPTLSLSASGKLLDMTLEKKMTEGSGLADNNSDNTADVAGEGEGDEEERVHESSTLLFALYRDETGTPKAKETTAKTSSFKVNLGYDLTENASSEDEFNYEEKSGEKLSSNTSFRLNFSSSYGNVYTLTDKVVLTLNAQDNRQYSTSDTVSKNLKSTGSNDTTLTFPKFGLTYNLSLRLYSYASVFEGKYLDGAVVSEENREEMSEFHWDKDTVKAHKLTYSKSFSIQSSKLSFSASLTLPPLSATFEPSLSWSLDNWSSRFSWRFVEKNGNYASNLISYRLSYSSRNLSSTLNLMYHSENLSVSEKFLDPLSGNFNLTLKSSDGKWSIGDTLKYRYLGAYDRRNYIEELKTTFKASYLTGDIVHITESDGSLGLSYLSLKANVPEKHLQTWKGRVYTAFAATSNLRLDFISFNRSTFSISPKLIFSVAEFMDISASFTTTNNRVGGYMDGGKFSFGLMAADLIRSFDFIGDGRRNTAFILNNVSLDFTHYMEDWDLDCKYSTEIVKSGHVYTLQPSLTIALAWKTMPDLKAEEKWKQTLVDGTASGWEQY